MNVLAAFGRQIRQMIAESDGSRETTPPNTPAPRRAARLIWAVILGAGALVYEIWRLPAHAELLAKDFTTPWRAARALLNGQNPYDVIRPIGAFPFDERFLYPLPTAIATVPFAPFGVYTAGALFMGVSTALLAYAVSREGWWQLLIFVSPAYVVALWSVQWSPLVTVSALTPTLAWLAVVKPNLGIAALTFRPRVQAVVGCALFLAVGTLLIPTWPLDWLRTIRAPLYPHVPVVTWPFGFVALLAVLRWRTREGRLLLAMASVPTAMWYYDHLLLWLVPRTPRQSLFLSTCAWASFMAILTTGGIVFSHAGLIRMAPYQTLGMYLPAVIILLRRRDRFDSTVPSETRPK